jgi:hypothetical protein
VLQSINPNHQIRDMSENAMLVEALYTCAASNRPSQTEVEQLLRGAATNLSLEASRGQVNRYPTILAMVLEDHTFRGCVMSPSDSAILTEIADRTLRSFSSLKQVTHCGPIILRAIRDEGTPF